MISAVSAASPLSLYLFLFQIGYSFDGKATEQGGRRSVRDEEKDEREKGGQR
jgi:hypothetical protein